MSHPHRLLPNTALTSKCLSCVSLSLLATGFPVTPPEPGPAPSSASGFRPSGLCTPVSPGVPTGARNLGVCVFLLLLSFQISPHVFRLPPVFAPNLCYCLSAFSLQFSATTSAFSRNPLSTPHPLLPPPPTFVHPFFSRTLVSPSHTSYEPHGSSASPVWDLRRRWVMLTVCTETELVPTRVLSSYVLSKTSFPPSFALYSSLPTYNNTVHPSPIGDHTDVRHPGTDRLLRFVIPVMFSFTTPYTQCLCVPFENPHAFFSALHLVPRL